MSKASTAQTTVTKWTGEGIALSMVVDGLRRLGLSIRCNVYFGKSIVELYTRKGLTTFRAYFL